MFKKIALGILLLIAALLAYAATRPNTFRVERSITIKAPPERIAGHINDFHQWGAWSPWEKLDPNMKRTYQGPASGVGAAYAWDGNKEVGRGRMEITETTPSKTLIKLDFLQPFESHNTAEFTFVPMGDSTKVVWAMYGPNPYISKVMGIFWNMDKMIGGDFDKGLTSLKTVAEQPAPPPPPPPPPAPPAPAPPAPPTPPAPAPKPAPEPPAATTPR